MNTKLTAVVLAIAIILGAAAIIRLRSMPAINPAADRTSLHLLPADSFDSEKVTSIHLTFADGAEYVFERTGSAGDESWMQTKPVVIPMQDWSMRMLAQSAADLIVNRTITPAELTGDLAASRLGLDPAAAVITFSQPDSGPSHTIYLGKTSAAATAFVRLDPTGPVYVVSDALHQRVLGGQIREWRLRNIFSIDGQDLDRIRIQHFGFDAGSASPSVVALSKVDGQWRLLEPVVTDADPDAASRLASSIGSAMVRGWAEDVPANPGIYGLDSPEYIISIEDDRPAPADPAATTQPADASPKTQTRLETLHLGNAIDLTDLSRYARRDDRSAVFTINANSVKAVTPAAEDLVSKSVLRIPPNDVRSFTVSGQAGKFKLERSAVGWDLTPEGAAARPADAAVVEALLNRLATPQEAVEFGALPDTGAGSPVAQFVIQDFSGVTVATIRLAERKLDDTTRRLIFDDGAGVLRYTTNAEMPRLTAADYEPAPAATTQPADGAAPATQPADQPVK